MMSFGLPALRAGNDGFGAYHRGLAWCAENESAVLDREAARAIANSAVWRKVERAGLALQVDGGYTLVQLEPGVIVTPRAVDPTLSEKRREAALAGARARWGNGKPDAVDAKPDSKSIANDAKPDGKTDSKTIATCHPPLSALSPLSLSVSEEEKATNQEETERESAREPDGKPVANDSKPDGKTTLTVDGTLDVTALEPTGEQTAYALQLGLVDVHLVWAKFAGHCTEKDKPLRTARQVTGAWQKFCADEVKWQRRDRERERRESETRLKSAAPSVDDEQAKAAGEIWRMGIASVTGRCATPTVFEARDILVAAEELSGAGEGEDVSGWLHDSARAYAQRDKGVTVKGWRDWLNSNGGYERETGRHHTMSPARRETE